jgi:hypothetical protein
MTNILFYKIKSDGEEILDNFRNRYCFNLEETENE